MKFSVKNGFIAPIYMEVPELFLHIDYFDFVFFLLEVIVFCFCLLTAILKYDYDGFWE